MANKSKTTNLENKSRCSAIKILGFFVFLNVFSLHIARATEIPHLMGTTIINGHEYSSLVFLPLPQDTLADSEDKGRFQLFNVFWVQSYNGNSSMQLKLYEQVSDLSAFLMDMAKEFVVKNYLEAYSQEFAEKIREVYSKENFNDPNAATIMLFDGNRMQFESLVGLFRFLYPDEQGLTPGLKEKPKEYDLALQKALAKAISKLEENTYSFSDQTPFQLIPFCFPFENGVFTENEFPIEYECREIKSFVVIRKDKRRHDYAAIINGIAKFVGLTFLRQKFEYLKNGRTEVRLAKPALYSLIAHPLLVPYYFQKGMRPIAPQRFLNGLDFDSLNPHSESDIQKIKDFVKDLPFEDFVLMVQEAHDFDNYWMSEYETRVEDNKFFSDLTNWIFRIFPMDLFGSIYMFVKHFQSPEKLQDLIEKFGPFADGYFGTKIPLDPEISRPLFDIFQAEEAEFAVAMDDFGQSLFIGKIKYGFELFPDDPEKANKQYLISNSPPFKKIDYIILGEVVQYIRTNNQLYIKLDPYPLPNSNGADMRMYYLLFQTMHKSAEPFMASGWFYWNGGLVAMDRAQFKLK